MSMKILKLNNNNLLLRCYNCRYSRQKHSIFLSLSSSSSINKFHHFNKINNLKLNHNQYRKLSSINLPPYVNLPYSYAFGRSLNYITYETIGKRLDDRLKYENGQPVIIFHHENIKKTFTEFYNDINQLAKLLYEQLNIKKGDIVGLWSCNTYDWIVIQYACLRIGAILCTVNPYYQTYELDYAIRKGEMKALFMPGKNSKQEKINNFNQIIMKTLEIQSNDNDNPLPLFLENIVTIDGDGFETNDLVEKFRNKIRLFELKKLKQNVGNNELDSKILNSVLPDDPAVIMFTSGTTGRPKGACLSHFNIVNNVLLTSKKALLNDNEHATYCVPLPFFHSFAGIIGNLIPIASHNGKLLIPCLKYNVKQVVESMVNHQATHLLATPTLVIDLLNYIRDNKIQLPSLQELLAGGASMPVEIAHQFMEIIPNCKIRVAYGATETSPCVSSFTQESTVEESIETVGSPLDFVEIKLINPQTKQLVKIGEHGELHCRGHVVMLGYWRDPEKTKECIDDGNWYNTGDLAQMTEKGMIKISGRTKELIIVGGENVYPREIEEILYTHPAVDSVNVIGVPDKRKGEEICAWIKLHKDVTITEDEIKNFCKERLTYFKIPKYILFVDDKNLIVPMTPTGKAQKFKMQKITIEKLNL